MTTHHTLPHRVDRLETAFEHFLFRHELRRALAKIVALALTHTPPQQGEALIDELLAGHTAQTQLDFLDDLCAAARQLR